MFKKDLIDQIAAESGLTKKASSAALEAMMTVIGNTLIDGDEVHIVGFGKFYVKDRCARRQFNPAKDEYVDVAERKMIKFKPSVNLKAAVNDND